MKQALGVLMLVSITALAVAADKPSRTLLVTGIGHITVAPDICYMRLGAQTSSPHSASAAYRENCATVNAVVQALKTAGIPANDIQTNDLYVTPNYSNDPKTGKNSLSGYSVSQFVSVKVRDLTKVSAVLDAGVAAGANDVGGVRFTVEDAGKYTERARTEALKDAKTKAETMAADAGVKLGEVMSIEAESDGGYRLEVTGAGGPSSQLQVGETEISQTVDVTYSLE